MIFANLKNGCKRACNLVKNSRAVRFCALVAVCLTFNVATALADSGAGYEAGKNAISQASEQIAQYVPIATLRVCEDEQRGAGREEVDHDDHRRMCLPDCRCPGPASVLRHRRRCNHWILMNNTVNTSYPEYPVFKGLQRPLEFMGLRGRYITWAAITAGCAILSFIIAYSLLGFVVGLITLTVICAVGIALIILKQMKGLHTKHEFQGILIYRRDSEI